MLIPSPTDFDRIRNTGFRPQIVGCLLSNKKLLFVFKKEHELWQLPQGGIDNGETLKQAFFREMAEELGEDFAKTIDKNIQVIGEDEMEFPPAQKGSRELKNDAGEDIFMQGKKYFFVAAAAPSETFDITKTEFNDFKWLSHADSLDLCDRIYQKGKKRVTKKAVFQLKKMME